jgi:signal transduction histidine kinase
MVQPDIREDVEGNLAILIQESNKIETFAKFTLRNVSRDKRQRADVDLEDVVSTVFKFFAVSLKAKNIEVDLSGVQSVSFIRAFRIDWESIIVNLITNAILAMEDKAYNERRLRIALWENNQQIHLTFGDSGIGIPAGMSEDIFLPTISTKANERGDIIGTGMGLAIVKDFVESYSGGGISVSSPCEIGGAEFHIVVNVPKYSEKGKGEGEA